MRFYEADLDFIMHHGRASRRIFGVTILALAAGSLVGAAVGETRPAEVPEAHETAVCADCHGWRRAGAAVSTGTAEYGRNGRDQRCRACHTDQATGVDDDHTFHRHGAKTCLACHFFHVPNQLRAGDRTFAARFGDETVRRHCRSCHGPGIRLGDLDPAHFDAAAVVYHVDADRLANTSPSDACLKCHDAGNASVVPASVRAADPPRFNTHASHPYGVGFVPGQGQGDGRIREDIDPRLPLPGGRIECQTCHQVTSGTEDFLVPFEDPYALCLGCHQVGDEPATTDVIVAVTDGP